MRTLALAFASIAIGPAMASQGSELANPAAVYCIEDGGRFEVEQTADGERGICVLPDGRRVDAWDHFRQNQNDTSDGS